MGGEVGDDLLGGGDHAGLAEPDQLVHTDRGSAGDGPWDAHDGPVQGLGPPCCAEGGAADGALYDHGAFGQTGDDPVSGEETGARGRGSRWRLSDDEATFGDRLE